MSKNVENSYGVYGSGGVNESYGVNGSGGVSWSDGVYGSGGVYESYGVNKSDGVYKSYGVLNGRGVSRAIFLADYEPKSTIFGKEVCEGRFDEVWRKLLEKLDGWYPKFNNALKLYKKAGNDWKKVNSSEIHGTLENWERPYEAWKDMPKQALDYVKSLPEFNEEMFKRITGISIEDDRTEEAMELLKSKGYKIIK